MPDPTPIVVTPVPTKPGYATTEFWLTALTSLIGILLASGIVHPGTPFDKAIGFIVTALAGMGYTVSRGMVKAAAAKAVVMTMLVCVVLFPTGCSLLTKDPNLTPVQKVNNLKRDYDLALPVITLMIDAGIIPASLADAVGFARKEARTFIDEALTAAKANALDWEFYYTQALASLGRYLQFKANGTVEAKRLGLDPKHLPATRPAPPVTTNWREPWLKPFLSPCLA